MYRGMEREPTFVYTENTRERWAGAAFLSRWQMLLIAELSLDGWEGPARDISLGWPGLVRSFLVSHRLPLHAGRGSNGDGEIASQGLELFFFLSGPMKSWCSCVVCLHFATVVEESIPPYPDPGKRHEAAARKRGGIKALSCFSHSHILPSFIALLAFDFFCP
jgi:hypothetical protein